MRLRLCIVLVLTSTLSGPAVALADEQASLADYFGFEPLEVLRIGRDAGPAIVADMNGNGLNDLVVVNNFASRIEIHYQKPDASPDDPVPPPTRVNEFPEHWRFKREHFSVTHRVTAIAAHDFDGDGLMDIIYAGQPAEIVFVRQTSPGLFRAERRHRVRNLTANRNGFAIADVLGDGGPELLALVGGEIHIWPLTRRSVDDLGTPVRLAAGTNMSAFLVEDFTGNGAKDVAGLVPDDAAPIRMWFGERERGQARLGPQVRFEMPVIREMEAVRLAGVAGARLAAIEQASRRLVILEVAHESDEAGAAHDAAYHVHAFTDPGARKRSVIVSDLDGNGLLDVVSTDTQANAVVVFRQEPGRGFLPAQSHPSLAELDYIAAGELGAGPELLVLSEREGVVGRSPVEGAEGSGTIPFPQPIRISEGFTPVAMSLVNLDGEPHLAVIAKSDRNHIIDLIDGSGDRRTIQLGQMTRSPETIFAVDADQDGRTDLLLFTRDRPMTMLRATSPQVHKSTSSQQEDEAENGDAEGHDENKAGFTLIESAQMGQFGLVQAARAENIAAFDIDGNGHQELLIADRNYIRAVRYEPDPSPGISPGWQVVRQINADDATSRLVSISVYSDRIFAADRENNRILIMERERNNEGFSTKSVAVRGFALGSIHAGSFGTGEGLIAVGSDGFAVVQLQGGHYAMRETDAWRSTEERHLHHEIAAGDINGDGLTDLIVLDAGDQLCEIFTFTQRGRLVHATGFKVYESRIFTGGVAREFQPNQAIIADVTGNGANDLILLAHDRVLIYPQMVAPAAAMR